MKLTRKEFLALSGGAGVGAALSRAFPSLAQDVTRSAVVQKIHRVIEEQKEQHISRVQADLRQPSVSSWNMGIQEMADRMVLSFRELGCKEAERVETDGFPGVFAYYDAAAPKTIVVYMMYDTQPFVKERWSRDPLAAERGPKGILEFELEASGERWGRGPQNMPIHSSRKAVLDRPVWRLLDALRSMYDPSENRILVDGFYDDIRPPNEEELMLMETLISKF